MTLLMRDQENQEFGEAKSMVRNIKTLAESIGSLDKALNLLKISEEEYEEALSLIENETI